MSQVVDHRPAKRVKVDHNHVLQQEKNQRKTSSRLFSPFRTIGLVSPTAVPFTSVPLGKTTFQITTSVGRSLQTYDLKRGLNLVFLSQPPCPFPITATFAYRDRILVAWGGRSSGEDAGVWIFKRGKLLAELELPSSSSQEILQILVFGSWIVGCSANTIEVWKSDTNEHYTTIRPASANASNLSILTGHICTLPTFLNKILVGRQDGNIEIYNISTARLVHTILAPSATSGRVTALAATPALCTIAVAYSDGALVIHDVETDEQILSLRNTNLSHQITSVSFRTDGLGAGDDGRDEGIMATTSIESGDVTLWDLNRAGKVVGVLRSAHEIMEQRAATGISKVEFLAGQPVIVTTGLDNALRTWVFDQNPFSPIPRQLHQRSGHGGPSTLVEFLPAASDGSESVGKWLLSAAQDQSLWGFSLRKDGQSTELSQGNIRHKAKKLGITSTEATGIESLKAAPIIDIACSLNRDGGMGAVGGQVWANAKTKNAEETATIGWESIVTAHKGDRYARTWSWGKKKAGRWILEASDHQPITKVAITSCGTFAVVGSERGCLDMYNLQSGMHHQKYPAKLTPAQARHIKQQQLQHQQLRLPRGHTSEITGIVIDALNRMVISASLDGRLVFWDFSTGAILNEITISGASPEGMRYNSVSGLLAVSYDDLCVRIVDSESHKVVRELWGCVSQIYDLCFSHDGRWVVTCSMDSVVRVFDLATGHLIDAMKLTSCTNVAFSKTGEFLATAHANSIGINIWTNKSLYTHVPTQPIDERTGIIDLSRNLEFQAASQLIHEETVVENGTSVPSLDASSDLEQIDSSLLTLSLVPQARWQTLLNLDTIRQRNKPIQPPEKPKAAPFFLGSSLAITGNQINSDNTRTNESTELAIADAEKSRISRIAAGGSSNTNSLTNISNLLSLESTDPLSHTSNESPSSTTPLITYLTSLPPASTDLEIRSLALSEMVPFVNALTAQIHRRSHFELVNTWMSVFLKIHGDFVTEVDELRDAVGKWKKAMEIEEERLSGLVGYTRGVLEFLRSAR